MSEVFMDEKYIGHVDDPLKFISDMKNERRTARLPQELNVFYNKVERYIR